MHRDTNEALANLEPLTLEQKIARAQERQAARDRAATEPHRIAAPTLPTASRVPVVTMTIDQLHDLAYHAVTQSAGSSVTREQAHTFAARVATRAQQIAHAEDYIERVVPT